MTEPSRQRSWTSLLACAREPICSVASGRAILHVVNIGSGRGANHIQPSGFLTPSSDCPRRGGGGAFGLTLKGQLGQHILHPETQAAPAGPTLAPSGGRFSIRFQSPAGSVGAPQDQPLPRGTDHGPQDESIPMNGSGPRRSNQGSALRMNQGGPPLDASGPRRMK